MSSPVAPAVRYQSLEGRSVFVTGGGSGIGAAIVRGFAGQGAKVAFADIAREPSLALESELRAGGATVRFLQANITDLDALKGAIAAADDAHGPITALVNNAAHDQRHTIEEVTPAYWEDRMAVNLRHHFFAAQAVVPMMRNAGRGAIVNLGSISWRVGSGSLPVYVTAKAAIEGLTRGLARELGEDGIRVNCVAPGWIMTERQLTLWMNPETEAKLMQDQCLQRRLEPVEIAKVVMFLASDEASAMTGQTVVVDGGWTWS